MSIFNGTQLSAKYRHWRSVVEPFLDADYRQLYLEGVNTASELDLLLNLTLEDYQLTSDVQINKRKIKLGLL